MFKIKNIAILLLTLTIYPIYSAYGTPAQTQTPVKQQIQATRTTPLQLVLTPSQFLNKNIIMEGKFDKFSTLGLDYKKAYRDSAKYIGFLVQRDDVKDHNVPLSELKLFMKREYAEKFIDLNTGDKISMSGKVFSNALGDAWVDIETITVLEKVPSKDK